MVAGALGRALCCCILCLSQDRKVWGILLLYAMCVISCHSLSCCSLHSGSVYNLWIRYRYAAILCSSEWLERKLMVVSVEVGFVEDAYVEVGWFSGYEEVEEVNGVCGFHRRT